MKDDKNLNELNLSKDELSEAVDKTAVTEDNFSSAIDRSQEYSNKALDDELERLAQTFRQELKKAQSMSEEELIKNGIVIQQYEDDDGVIPEEELCQCCGEQRRDKSFGENYEYCKDCREAMRRYPLSIPSIIILAAVVFAAVVSVFSFAADFDIYNTVRQGDEYIAQNKLYSAFDSYDGAISAFEDEDVVAKKLYLKTAKILYHTMPDGVYSMSDVSERIETALSQLEAQLPIYSDYVALHREAQVLYNTMYEIYALINSEEYAGYDLTNDEQYEELMTEIGSVIDKEITVTSIDGKSSEIVASSEAMVRFCQYMFAYSNGKYEDSYQYMNAVYELEPSYLWLYAYELGIVELQKGDMEKAQFFADALYESNVELPDAYALQSSVARMSGNQKKAIEWADKGIEAIPDNAELYRIKAMAYIAKGDFETAKEITDKALELEEYGLLYMVALVVENELGNEDRVEELKSSLDNQGIELSEKMENYFKGKITAQQMFTEGTGEAE